MQLLLLLLSFAVVAWGQDITQWLDDPDSFFDQSNPRLEYNDDDEQIHLIMITPIAVLCSAHFVSAAIIDDNNNATNNNATLFSSTTPLVFDGARTMLMSAPAEYHEVVLPFGTSLAINNTFVISAFLPNGYTNILQSSPYAVPDNPTPTNPTVALQRQTNTSRITTPQTCGFELQLANVTTNNAAFALSSQPESPLVSSLAYGPQQQELSSAIVALQRVETTTAHLVPELRLQGLETNTSYQVVACFVDMTTHICCTQQPPLTFQTLPDESAADFECLDDNVALLSMGASILEVSSNWGTSVNNVDASFGGNKAIDGQASTAWSSNGNGNEAFIVVELPEPTPVAGVGVWSRAMTNSAEILSFSVELSNVGSIVAEVLGPFDLPTTDALYRYDFMEFLDDGYDWPLYTTVRLNVVTSTGGNTGLRTLEVYPLLDSCVTTTTTNGAATSNSSSGNMTDNSNNSTTMGPDDEVSSVNGNGDYATNSDETVAAVADTTTTATAETASDNGDDTAGDDPNNSHNVTEDASASASPSSFSMLLSVPLSSSSSSSSSCFYYYCYCLCFLVGWNVMALSSLY